MSKYHLIDLSKARDNYYLYAMVGRKKIKMNFDNEERRTLLPQEVVEQLLNSNVISVDNFSKGNEKIKLTNGMKVYSTSFTIPELEIGGMIFKDVKCKMVEARADAVLGYNVFKEYEEVTIKDDKIWLLKNGE
jgi:hypothetical protein